MAVAAQRIVPSLGFGLSIAGLVLIFIYFRYDTSKKDVSNVVEDWWSQESLAIDHKTRWRRQAIPSNNVQVYATNSNISVADQIQVLSAESRIQLIETHFNGTVWSNSSLLRFDSPEATAARRAGQGLVSLSASDAIAVDLHLNAAHLEAMGDTLQFNASTERDGNVTAAHDTSLTLQMTGRVVNFSFSDSGSFGAHLRAINGQLAAIQAQSWTNESIRPKMSLLSAVTGNSTGSQEGGGLRRELSVAVQSPNYEVQLRLEGNEVVLFFAGIRIDIAANHRTVVLRLKDGSRRLSLHTANSPFEVTAADGKLSVNCFDEATTMEVSSIADRAPLSLTVGQLSRLYANRSSSPNASSTRLSVNGAVAGMVDTLELVARQLRLFLNIGDEKPATDSSSILIDSSHSQLKLLHSNRSDAASLPMISATLTAARHLVEMVGGDPVLVLQTGNVTFMIETENATAAGISWEVDGSLLPAELTAIRADDDFLGIGPFASNLSGTVPKIAMLNDTPIQAIPVEELPTAFLPSRQKPRPSEIDTNWIRDGYTPRMVDVDRLFTFRQSLPPQLASTIANTNTVESGGQNLPTPIASLFTFSPTEASPTTPPKPLTWIHQGSISTANLPQTPVPSTTEQSTNNTDGGNDDFVVGQFETATLDNETTTIAMALQSANATEGPFPIEATIVTIQYPEEYSNVTDSDFKGIYLENRPNQNESERFPEPATVEKRGRQSRELLRMVNRNNRHQENRLVELDVRLGGQKEGQGDKLGTDSVSLRLGLEHSLESLLNGLLKSNNDQRPPKPPPARDRRKIGGAEESEETVSENAGKEIRVWVRDVARLMSTGAERDGESVRVRFAVEGADANEDRRDDRPEENGQQFQLDQIVINTLNAALRDSPAQLSQQFGGHQVLSDARLHNRQAPPDSDGFFDSPLAVVLSIVLILVVCLVALIWAIAATKIKDGTRLWWVFGGRRRRLRVVSQSNNNNLGDLNNNIAPPKTIEVKAAKRMSA